MEKYFNYTQTNDDKFNIDYYNNNNNKIEFDLTNNVHLHTKPRKVSTNIKLKNIKLKEKILCKYCNCYIFNYKIHTKSKKHQQSFNIYEL